MGRWRLAVNIATTWWIFASLVAFARASTPDGEKSLLFYGLIEWEDSDGWIWFGSAGEALLELKLGFNDSKQLLWSWRPTDSHPCSSWLGVSCHPSDLTVRSM